MKANTLLKITTGRERYFLALLSSVLTLFVANAVLELNSSIRNQYVHMSLQSALRIETDSTGVPLDRRTKMDVVRDLRKTDPEVYPSSWTHTFLDHMSDEEKQNGRMLVPLAFKSNVTSVICNESGQWSIFKTDRYGFNNEWDVFTRRNGSIWWFLFNIYGLLQTSNTFSFFHENKSNIYYDT